jgi:hypothetical protein
MRHISYAESTFTTDEQLATLLLEYATLLARASSADTVTIPGRVGDGEVEQVALLVGPASQIASWSDDEPFGVDVTRARADLERRIQAMTNPIGSSDGPDGPEGFDEFDELS